MDNLTVVKPEDTTFVRCSACNKPLMRIFEKTKTDTVLYHLTVGCCWCGDKSFNRDLYGDMNCMPAEGVSLQNVEEDKENKRIHFLTTRKK